MMARPYFDSNVFIDLMEGEDELALPLQAVLLRLRDRGVRVVASELVLAEVLVKARLNGGAPLYRNISTSLCSAERSICSQYRETCFTLSQTIANSRAQKSLTPFTS